MCSRVLQVRTALIPGAACTSGSPLCLLHGTPPAEGTSPVSRHRLPFVCHRIWGSVLTSLAGDHGRLLGFVAEVEGAILPETPPEGRSEGAPRLRQRRGKGGPWKLGRGDDELVSLTLHWKPVCLPPELGERRGSSVFGNAHTGVAKGRDGTCESWS